MKKMIIGIASPKNACVRALAFARGEHQPRAEQSFAYAKDDGALWSVKDATGGADGLAGDEWG